MVCGFIVFAFDLVCLCIVCLLVCVFEFVCLAWFCWLVNSVVLLKLCLNLIKLVLLGVLCLMAIF